MNFNFFTGGKWNLEKVAPPWKDRPSIYQHILANIHAGEPGLGEEGELLPDEDIVRGDSQLRWVPGALDGTFGHHTSHNEGPEAAKQIVESFRSLARKANDERAASLYSTLLGHSALTVVDHLLSAVV